MPDYERKCMEIYSDGTEIAVFANIQKDEKF